MQRLHELWNQEVTGEQPIRRPRSYGNGKPSRGPAPRSDACLVRSRKAVTNGIGEFVPWFSLRLLQQADPPLQSLKIRGGTHRSERRIDRHIQHLRFACIGRSGEPFHNVRFIAQAAVE